MVALISPGVLHCPIDIGTMAPNQSFTAAYFILADRTSKLNHLRFHI